ncbi:BZ3500_MvSof-1268-A1-R1_C055g00238 [Microbotryum saponariae]|nr:BZ3500_MvSof-1268-A1-R1_C055g00238 [Microbotryum saponariae]
MCAPTLDPQVDHDTDIADPQVQADHAKRQPTSAVAAKCNPRRDSCSPTLK